MPSNLARTILILVALLSLICPPLPSASAAEASQGQRLRSTGYTSTRSRHNYRPNRHHHRHFHRHHRHHHHRHHHRKPPVRQESPPRTLKPQ